MDMIPQVDTLAQVRRYYGCGAARSPAPTCMPTVVIEAWPGAQRSISIRR